ncbi:CRISPR-associated endonuclease Cas1 [Actinomadura harenae]|uniref:CRISPR-associated endonuclease Cas1 n=1 Tax=Actinomadura harenae TaxID=2483351 RepID=A0A3M2M3C0_9ACTN|nr:hypothetical protein [Actinomadura harenae]RMI44089.1 hypothetical protein EBO15_14320 [Actinomadura harenae]
MSRPPRNARQRLAAPTAAMLPRIGDSLSFLYIDVARIVQDDTGVKALIEVGDQKRKIALPTAALGCLLLGPGVSITSRALSAANTCLYGITHAAINAIGCSPGLGFVHTGTSHAFVYDVADLYKAELTLPLAFALHDVPDPEGEARRSFRDGLRLFRLLPRLVADVQSLLVPDDGTRQEDAQEASEELVDLWDPDLGRLAGGTNYGHD